MSYVETGEHILRITTNIITHFFFVSFSFLQSDLLLWQVRTDLAKFGKFDNFPQFIQIESLTYHFLK